MEKKEKDLLELRAKTPASKLSLLPENPEKMNSGDVVELGRFPSWLHRKMPSGENLWSTDSVMRSHGLHTVCEEAKCPNLLECWSKKTATYLVMGKTCTRNCGFCSIDFSKTPQPLEDNEPRRVAESAKQLGLKHVVITMVARDDLEDGGALHLTQVIEEIRKVCSGTTVEVLTSDFSGNLKALDLIMQVEPEIFNHNIETVRELTPRVRHKATYNRTLEILSHAKKSQKKTLIKSGLMVGLGETEDQVYETIRDLQEVGCSIITIGQYLQSDRRKLLVKSFVTPKQFDRYAEWGKKLGIKNMYCGPFVRSSYNAEAVFNRH